MIGCMFEILFLIFGWVFAVKGLVIASLVISIFWLIVGLVLIGLGCKQNSKSKLVMVIELICICFSIICLCIRF